MSIQVAPAPRSVAKPSVSVPFRLRPPIVLAAALALAYLPLLLSHAQTLWEKPHYQFFPWALLGAGVLAWRRRDRFQVLTPGLPSIGYTLLGSGWLLLAVGGYLVSPWLGMVAALLAFIGYLWLLGGGRLFAALFPSLVLLFVLVPPPLGLDTRLILLLQGSTTNFASRTLDWLELPHVRFAHTLQVASGQLLVDEACSGIASLFSVVTFTLFFGFFMRRKPLHLAALVLFAVVFVVLGNVVRVVAITLLKARYDTDLVTGWKHEMTGLLVFAVCLALTASMDQAILFFTEAATLLPWRKPSKTVAPAPPAAKLAAEEATAAPLSLRGAGFLGTAFAVVGLLTVYNAWIHPHAFRGDPSARSLDAASLQQKLDAELMPKQCGRWERENYERTTRSSTDPVGHYSDIWRYRHGKLEAIVSVDYPFRGSHDLAVCYTAKGWHEVAAAFPSLPGETGPATTAAVSFERSPIEKGYLWFSLLDDRGQWLTAEEVHNTTGINRLTDRFATEASSTVQVQVFVTTAAALEDSDREEARQLFQDVRTHLHDQLFSTGRVQP